MSVAHPPQRLRATRNQVAQSSVASLSGVPPGEAQDRLRILVLVALGSFVVIGAIAWLLPCFSPPATPATMGLGILAIKVVILCAGMLFLLRRQRSGAVLQTVGVGFVVLVALSMAAAEVSLAAEIGAARWGVSGIGIWIVLFPLVYPSNPRITLAAALSCASAVPLVYGAARLVGADAEPWSRLLPWMLPLYFCAGLAVVAALSIHRYRRALAQAKRELREFGRYDLVRRLGRGGMGEVWLARHRLLPRSAAIKFVAPPDEADRGRRDELDRQFEAEAAAISRLSSVHTVTLYDFGVADNGEWYYVMELLDGIDLQQAVESWGPFPDWRVARILAQACRSLAEAHRQRLIHRDIKPGNLMLCRLGDELDVIKIVDFGLVGLGQGEATGPGHQSPGPSSTWAGSAGYVAPEVLLGSGADDGRLDLYALGCVAWWLLTGKTIFPGVKELQEECVLHCTMPPPAAALRAASHDPGLVQLILELLAKRPDARPPDADTVRRRLMALPCWSPYDEAAVAEWWAVIPSTTPIELAGSSAKPPPTPEIPAAR